MSLIKENCRNPASGHKTGKIINKTALQKLSEETADGHFSNRLQRFGCISVFGYSLLLQIKIRT